MLDADRVPGVPDYSIATSVQYTMPVFATGLGRAGLNGQWIGPSQGTIYHGDPDFERPAYFVMGGNAGVKWDRFDVSLFVTNLLDEHKALQRPNVAGVEYGLTVRPRTFGVSGSYSF